MASAKLLQYLNEKNVDFRLVEHPNAFAARDVANRAGIAQAMFAKTVLVSIDGEPAIVVLPADSRIDFSLLQAAAGGKIAALCPECECEKSFPDCEPGTMPPFGPLYGLPVYVSGNLLRAERIAFNAGSHTEVVTMPFADFQRLVQPHVGYFSFRGLRARKARA